MSDKDEYYVVVTERDHYDWKKASGAIVIEQYLKRSSLDEARERVEKLSGCYGFASIARLDFDWDKGHE